MTVEAAQKRPLDEVMMAMDVVDTLRHRQLLVDRELNSDQREQNLIERLRELYASQGIEVTDQILAEGVKALEEDRFRYTAAKGGFKLMMAKAYIARGKWGWRLGVLLLLLLVARGVYYFSVEAPENRRIEQQFTQFNDSAQAGSDSLAASFQRIDHLQGRLDSASPQIVPELGLAAERLSRNARQSLDEARGLLETVQGLETQNSLSLLHDSQDFASIEKVLNQQKQGLADAKMMLDSAQANIEFIVALADLPLSLAAERDIILQRAKVDEAGVLAKQYYADSMTALAAGDIALANASFTRLEALREQLNTQYRLRIVSQSDEYSGVWRIPEQNPDAKNYYIIVEAIDEDGQPLSLPVLNEEDGKIYQVEKWGIRVAESIFKKVAADKNDDGIIQTREIGIKSRGYLEPDLSIKTDGGTLTSW